MNLLRVLFGVGTMKVEHLVEGRRKAQTAGLKLDFSSAHSLVFIGVDGAD